MKKYIIFSTLIILTILVGPVLSRCGHWEELRSFKGPEGYLYQRGVVHLKLYSFRSYFDIFGYHQEKLIIDDGGWGYGLHFESQSFDKKEWAAECNVIWGSDKIVLETPDGFSISVSRDYLIHSASQ